MLKLRVVIGVGGLVTIVGFLLFLQVAHGLGIGLLLAGLVITVVGAALFVQALRKVGLESQKK